jgi:creatinine amidohydrolase
VAVLPVGAIEQHGSHLPVGTDTIFAVDMASKIAEKIDGYLLPVIPISSSIEHRKGKGTVYIKSETLALIVRDIAESLHFSGFQKLIIVNCHGGNWIIKPTIRRINRELANMQVILIDSNIASHTFQEIFKNVNHDLHAGEVETSLMLDLHPEYVTEIKRQNDPVFVPQSYMDYFDVTEVTEDGYWGFPEEGTAEKGRKAMDLMVECALDYINDVEKVTMKLKSKSIVMEKDI